MSQVGTHVLVTTQHMGLFYGEVLITFDPAGNHIQLKNAIRVTRLPAGYGLINLATSGPSSFTELSDPVEEILLNNVTAVVKCYDSSLSRWPAPLTPANSQVPAQQP